MTPALRAALYAFLVFTAYFIAGSLVSDSMRFPYGYVSLGAIGLFALTGYYIARHYRLHSAAIATAIAALLASVAAWIVLGLLNPLRAPTPRPGSRRAAAPRSRCSSRSDRRSSPFPT